MTPSQVFALRPAAASTCRLDLARERLAGSFWPAASPLNFAGYVVSAMRLFQVARG